MNKLRLFVAFSILIFISWHIYSQSDEDIEQQARELFDQARHHLDNQEWLKAYEKIEQALRLNPASDFLRYQRDKLGEKYLRVMLARPELRSTAERLIELAKGGIVPWKRTPEEINQYVVGLDTDIFEQKYSNLHKLVAIGQRACPYLIPILGDETNDRWRVNVIHTLEKLKSEAVLPVIEALQSSKVLIRQNAAIILGTIRDERAIPELKRVYEDPDEIPEVKSEAARALYKITGQPVEKLLSAKEYYYKLAEKYYYNHPTVMINLYGTYLIWRWDKENDTLTSREVSEFIYNLELAEECCYDALKLDENYEPVIPLLICIYLAQYNDGKLVLQSTSHQVRSGILPESEFDKLQEELKVINQGYLFGQMGTRKYLYQALDRSLKDNRIEVAVSIIKALIDCAQPDDLPLPLQPQEKTPRLEEAIGEPLVRALEHEDKRVRYTAAECLMKISPRNKFFKYEKVIPTIIDALGETGIRVVLIIEEDLETRNQLKKLLLKLNCFPIEATNATEGLEKAKRFPTEDVIICNAKIANQVIFSTDVLGKEFSETVFDSLKTDIRTKAIPIILLTDPEHLEMYKSVFKEEAQGYLTKPIDKSVLQDMLDKLFGSEEAQQDSKARADEVAQLAAEALANLELVNCIYPYLETVEPLIGSLEARVDKIRIPAMKALGRFGSFKAIEALTKVLHNKENAKEVRIAAAQAMSEIFRVNPDPIPDETYAILKEVIQEPDFDLQKAVATAIGNAKLTLVQRREIFQLKRLHPK